MTMPRPIRVHGEDGRLYFPRDTEFKLIADTKDSHDDESIIVAIPGRKSVSELLNEAMIKESGSAGIKCIATMIQYLRKGDFQSALITRQLEKETSKRHPAIEELLKNIFGCSLHGAYSCRNEDCAWCLWLDDQYDDAHAHWRHPPTGYVPARSSIEAMRLVRSKGLPYFISFDHDYGILPSGKSDDAMVFLTWLIDTYPHAEIPEYRIHSANFIGRMNIEAKMASWKRCQEL